MKFSDIRKKEPAPEPPAAAPPPAPAETSPPPPGVQTPPSQLRWPTKAAGQAQPKAPEPKPESDLQSQQQVARKAYKQAILAMQWLIDNIVNDTLRANDTLTLVVRAIIQLVKTDNQALAALATCSTQQNYLYAHSVNTAIFATMAGHGFGWNDSELQSLGVCALLQDIGMVQYLELASQPRELKGPERDKVRSHPFDSQKLLDRISDMNPVIRKWISEVIGEELAWKSGNSKNQAGKTADIPTIARILGLCDLYEAMTHPRAWRKGISPHEMIKNLLKQHSQQLEPVLVKNFVQRLSLFPPGSFVHLSTQESGYVAMVHPDRPTRPTVEIRIRPDGAAYATPRLIDLGENPTTHILGAIEESQAGIKDPNLLKQLEASHWWTE